LGSPLSSLTLSLSPILVANFWSSSPFPSLWPFVIRDAFFMTQSYDGSLHCHPSSVETPLGVRPSTARRCDSGLAPLPIREICCPCFSESCLMFIRSPLRTSLYVRRDTLDSLFLLRPFSRAMCNFFPPPRLLNFYGREIFGEKARTPFPALPDTSLSTRLDLPMFDPYTLPLSMLSRLLALFYVLFSRATHRLAVEEPRPSSPPPPIVPRGPPVPHTYPPALPFPEGLSDSGSPRTTFKR